MPSHSPEVDFDLVVRGVIRRGHGVASGSAAISPYPGGTLALQIPLFKQQGVDLSGFFCGTLNVDISPLRFQLTNPEVTLRKVAWTDRIPPEDFSFCPCLLEALRATHRALVYYPHPETKVEHFQNESVIEVLAPFIPHLGIGSRVRLRLRSSQVRVCE